MTKWDLVAVIGVAWGMAGALGVIIFLVEEERHSRKPSETCWQDPHGDLVLDFDFHTLNKDGAPIRCGYLPPDTTSVLPQVLGENARGVYSDIMCYPMAKKECKPR